MLVLKCQALSCLSHSDGIVYQKSTMFSDCRTNWCNRVLSSKMGGRALSCPGSLSWSKFAVWAQEAGVLSTFKIRFETFLVDKAYSWSQIT